MKPLQPLTDDQAHGAAPPDHAWVSASAGTGKTQVLTARVLRLLLGGAVPERILCLTFTKAAAAEMQGRIFDRLAAWATATDAALRHDLDAIRAATDAETVARARQLFARVLEARGGLNVQTLHGYAQSLLASFPLEAGIAPGFAALDDRSALTLRGRVLAESIEAAALAGDTGFAHDLAAISIASGELRLAQIAATLVRFYEAISSLGAPIGYEAQLRRKFGLPTDGSSADVLGAMIAELDHLGLRRLAKVYEAHGGSQSLDKAETLLWWLDCALAAQVEHFGKLHQVFHRADGLPRVSLVPGGKRADPRHVAQADHLREAVGELHNRRMLLDVAATAARHLRVGARLGQAYAEHKRRAGVIDYDDMIVRAARLLMQPGMGDWVRYKLDRRIDHLLVDEAQDTNADQWAIVGALTDEFFDGEGARDVHRTLFVVGDFKQAIFSFQGSDPHVFNDRRELFQGRAADALLGWRDVPLSASFRSVPAVLEVVDAVVEELGPEAFGRPDPIPAHVAARGDLPGSVTLWPPLAPDIADEDADEFAWLPKAQVQMAHRLARQIAAWLDPADPLQLPARGRAVQPQDILVLVRSRGEFVGALVAALHDLGVPIAGVDRLRLTAPLAVQDCLALIRFALQPGDDLTCATLLTSPFLGWDQDALFALAHRRRGSLWSALRESGSPAADWLGEVLRLADFTAPYEFLEQILSGPLQGRRKLLKRLGGEAREAIAALLAQALAFEAVNAPSLQGFLSWVETDDIDLKRDPEAPVDAVRILTIHAAKGLQAPVVVLADATAAQQADSGGHVMLELGDPPVAVPIFHGGKVGRLGPIEQRAASAQAERAAEHWRLLYVALTRAEDLLFVGGALARPRGSAEAKLPEDSWYAHIEAAVVTKWEPADEPDPLWGSVRRHRAGSAPPVLDAAPAGTLPVAALPAWALAQATPELRPPQPLSPSAIAADDIAQPPPGPAAQAAARRGQLLHSLFERLPRIAGEGRARVGAAWLARTAPDLDDATRAALLTTALGIVGAPRFAALFGPDALAEAPIAATVGSTVIVGKVDRLLIEADRVQLIDFKTGLKVPATAAEAAPYHLRQMAAYTAALAKIFPATRIDAALLYTATATLIELPPALLSAHAPALN